MMNDLLARIPPAIWAPVTAVLAVVALVTVLAARAMHETREDHLTACAILHVTDERDRRLVKIQYGRLRLPFTLGWAGSARVACPRRVIPSITSPEELVAAGIRLQQALGWDSSETRTPRARTVEWILS